MAAFKTQLIKGTLDLAALTLIAKRDCYGYQISKILRDSPLEVNEGTLYPLLRRLEKQKFVKGRVEKHGRQIRRIYSITPSGKEELKNRMSFWMNIVKTMAEIS